MIPLAVAGVGDVDCKIAAPNAVVGLDVDEGVVAALPATFVALDLAAKAFVPVLILLAVDPAEKVPDPIYFVNGVAALGRVHVAGFVSVVAAFYALDQ